MKMRSQWVILSAEIIGLQREDHKKLKRICSNDSLHFFWVPAYWRAKHGFRGEVDEKLRIAVHPCGI